MAGSSSDGSPDLGHFLIACHAQQENPLVRIGDLGHGLVVLGLGGTHCDQIND